MGQQVKVEQVFCGMSSREVSSHPISSHDTSHCMTSHGSCCRGDPGNVAFGGLYRADIALYRRHDPAGCASMMGAKRRGYGPIRYGHNTATS